MAISRTGKARHGGRENGGRPCGNSRNSSPTDQRLANSFTLTLRRQTAPPIPLDAEIAPVLLTSAIDPASEILVVRNKLTARFAAELARMVPTFDGRPNLRFIDYDAHPSDVWAQDTMELGVTVVPDAAGIQQTSVALLGLRGKHDMGLTCGPLDAFVEAMVRRERPDIIPVTIGEPRAGARWIDWYGNLEVSPPVKGFPMGRILTGEQRGLTIHPDVLTFLEAQKLQWPPLFLNVGWLTIGHVDELINFVPAKDGQGFRALLPSPKLASTLLENAVKSGYKSAKVFAGHKTETTVERLLLEVAKSRESETIEAALSETRKQLRAELGIEDADIIEMPVLFRDGLPVIPNGVNCLVAGQDVVIPDPAGPIIERRGYFPAVNEGASCAAWSAPALPGHL